MDAQQLITRIRRLHRLQALTIVFSKTGTVGAGRLFSMINGNKRIKLGRNEEGVLLAVAMSGDWGHERNRSVVVYGLSTADDGWLAELARDIDRVEVSGHGAKDLMSSRTVMQKEAMEAISRRVVTPNFCEEMKGWDVTIATDLLFNDGFPVLRFSLTYLGEVVGSAGVDGFSGRLMLNGQFQDELYMTPDQIQKLIRDWIERLMEQFTAA